MGAKNAANNNIKIVNLSWWNFPKDEALKQAIANYPGLFVAIAGNAGTNIDATSNYPASFDCANIISVGATKANSDNPAEAADWNWPIGSAHGSNFGANSVDLFAPGTNIHSTIPGTYGNMSGTSMAAPHVAGVAALIKSKYPELTAAEIKQAIMDGVDKISGLSEKCVTGGRLNARKALDSVKFKITYHANGGIGAPASQTKIAGVDLAITSVTPTHAKDFALSYNANGGSVSPGAKAIDCIFKNWNTNLSGTGTSYNYGDTYTANASTTLYAQWYNPTAGTLPTPTRSGYMFRGWYTAASGGTKVTSSTPITGDTTIYAQWTAAPIMSLNTAYTSNISQGGQEVYYSFKPSTSGAYKIYSETRTSDIDPYVNLYTGGEYQLAYNDDGETNLNFNLTYWLRAGQTYYFKTRLYNTTKTGSFTVKIVSTTATTYTITYNGNASGVTDVPTADTKVSVTPLGLTKSTPIRANYVFLGWHTSSTATIPTYFKDYNGIQYNYNYSLNANTTLYAVWGLRGDVDMSGKVTLADSQLALRVSLNIESLTEHQKKLMDYNEDGRLNLADSQLILRNALNII